MTNKSVLLSSVERKKKASDKAHELELEELMVSNRKISADKLRKIAYEHISYEIEMFVFSAEKLRRGELSVPESNALLETFLIHARCLLDFLYPPKKTRTDDVLAIDFFEDPQVLTNSLPKSLPISSYLKRRAGKEIAHLTYSRLNVTPSQKVWNFGVIYDQIGEALAIFFECLTEEKRRWFKNTVTR